MAEPKVSVTIRVKDRLTKTIRGLRGKLKGLATQGFRLASQAAARFGAIMAGAVAGGIALATKRAAEFSQRMGEVQTLLGSGSEAQASVRGMSAAILEMTSALPKTADDLGAGLYQVLSAGVERGAAAMRVLEIAAKAATGGLSTTLESVDALTTVINAYGGDASKATAISDNMFQTVKDGKITFTQLASTIGTVATTAALAKVSFGDLSAAIAVMTKSGLDAAITTTSLNRLILAIISPQNAAAAAAKKLGIELSSTALAQRGFAGLMADIAKATNGNIDALQALFPEVRAFRAISILAGANAGEFARLVDNQANSMGAAAEAFEVMNKRITQQFQLFKNKFNVVLIELGNKLLPGLSQGLQDAAGPLERMRDFVRDNAVFLKDMGVQLGNAISWVLKFGLAVARIAKNFARDVQVAAVFWAEVWLKFPGVVEVASGKVLVTLANMLGESRILLTLFGDAFTEMADRVGAAGTRMVREGSVVIRNAREGAAAMRAEMEETGGGGGGTRSPTPGIRPGDPRVIGEDTAIPELKGIGDFDAMLERTGAAIRASLVDPLTAAQHAVGQFKDAFALGMEASLLSAEGFGDVFTKATIGAVKNTAKILARKQFAEAAADFAGGLWPPNPVQLAAGAKHLAAGALFTAIGGGGGGRAGVGSGGGGAAPGGFTNDRPFGGGSRGSITVQFPSEGFIRAGDPAFADWLADTLRRAGDRDVIINPVGA